jgi:hypothetical protein
MPRVIHFRRFSGLYAPFPSREVLGQFFLDSVLPCAAIPSDACSSSATLDTADTIHLEKVRELVQAAAAGLNATSNSSACCGPVSVLYCLADASQQGCLSADHMSNVLTPALTSLLRLQCLSFADLSAQGCRVVGSLIDRLSPDVSCSVVVVDVNATAVLDETTDAAGGDNCNKILGELDSLISCGLKAITRACKLKFLFVLPKAASATLMLSRLPALAGVPDGFFTTCQLQSEVEHSWDIYDDKAAASSVPVMCSLLGTLRSVRYEPSVSSQTCWWQLWDAQAAVFKAIAPPLMSAVSILKNQSAHDFTRPGTRAAPASRLSTRSSLMSRKSTSSLSRSVADAETMPGRPTAVECMCPAIICSFADDVNDEEVFAWFRQGGTLVVTERVSQPSDSDATQETAAPILATTTRYAAAASTMVAHHVVRDLIASLNVQLRGHDSREVEPAAYADLEDLQATLSRLLLCRESEQRGVILLLPCCSSDILHCFSRSMLPLPLHVVIILLTPVRMAQQVQTWLHPTIQSHLDDAAAAQVPVTVATVSGSRMPACINGHEATHIPADACDAADGASGEPSISWAQIYDTRCAMVMHRDFASGLPVKSNAVAVQQHAQRRASSPYSPQGSPRLGSPSSGRSTPHAERRSPLSSSLIRKIPHCLCRQSLTVASETFSSQAVAAVIAAVLALPGIPLHLLSYPAITIAREMSRDSNDLMSKALPSHRNLTSTAVCLAPFFFDAVASPTGLSLTAKFPNLQENFEVQFGISRLKWDQLQQSASLSLMLVADPSSDATFVGLAGAGSWLSGNLLLALLHTNCHDSACEVASNVLMWHAVEQRLGPVQAQCLVQQCCGILEYLVLQEGPETFKIRVLRNALSDLRCILDVFQMNLSEGGNVGILERIVLRIWLSAKPAATLVNLASAALSRIAALQQRVIEMFKNSATILKSSAPGCVWRLLQRANAAEWLSHVSCTVPRTRMHPISHVTIRLLETIARCCREWPFGY